jgi:hypothetical protein
MAWHVLRLLIEEMASRYEGWLPIYWVSSCGQLTGAGPPAWGLGGRANNPHHTKLYVTKYLQVPHKWQIKLMRMRCVEHVARMGEDSKVCKVLMRNPEGRDHLEDQAIDGRMGPEWILGRLARGV